MPTPTPNAAASYDTQPLTREERNASANASRPDVLRAQVDDVRVLGALLRPIAFAAVANFSVSDAGIQVTTEADRSVQAVAYVSSSIFTSYEFDVANANTEAAEDGEADAGTAGGGSSGRTLESTLPALDFDINLHTMLECLNIFGGAPPGNTLLGKGAFSKGGGGSASAFAGAARGTTAEEQQQPQRATAMRMSWRGHGHPLVLQLVEQDVTTQCEIATFEPAEGMRLDYHQEDTQAQAILPSEYLFDALQSVDQSSCSRITLLFSNHYARETTQLHMTQRWQSPTSSIPTRAMLKLTSDGDFGTAETEFSSDTTSAKAPSVLEKFTCAKTTINSYRWSHFSRMLKAVQYSVRASIRVSDVGLMSIQLMMPRGTGSVAPNTSKTDQHGFLEFLVVPLEADDADGDDDEDMGSKIRQRGNTRYDDDGEDDGEEHVQRSRPQHDDDLSD